MLADDGRRRSIGSSGRVPAATTAAVRGTLHAEVRTSMRLRGAKLQPSLTDSLQNQGLKGRPICTCASRLVYFSWSMLRCTEAALARVPAADRCPVAARGGAALQGCCAAGVVPSTTDGIASASAVSSPPAASGWGAAGVAGADPFTPADRLRRRGGASAGLKVHSCTQQTERLHRMATRML
jgi:hypothetical protein